MTIMMTTTMTMIMMIICMSGTVNSYSSSPLVTRFKSCRTISNKRCFILIIPIIIIIITSVIIVITYNHDQGTFSDSEDDGVGGNVYQRQGFIIRAPNLK